ncbi:MAG: ABC transporter substrate-binding protein [Alphaproteobacteria bacterium]|nr:ABC transporter substrate-binding protein [Alphaproteobacteria bacterium]
MSDRKKCGAAVRCLALAGSVGLAMAFGADAQAQKSLSVGGIYGGVWADSIRGAFLDPFGKASGTQMRIEEGISGVTLAKLRQQKDNPQFDVVWMDRVVSDQAIRDGLIETIDPAAIGNLADVVPEAVIKNAAGQIVAFTTGYWAAGIAYNRQDVKQAPSSWLDLADPRFKGRIAIYSPENSISLPIMVTIAELKGGGLAKVDPAFEMMAKLSKEGAVFFGGSPAGANMLANGEVVVATMASSQVWDLQNKGFPIDYVVPKEGAVAGDIRIHVVKGTKNKALAEQLVNYTVGPEAQGEIAKRLLLGPVNTKTVLAPDVDRKMPWGPGGNVKRLRIVDANAILDNREAWTKRWNQEVAR